ncbi:DNA primase [Candidatus Margulisiibacteriota bacterium]
MARDRGSMIPNEKIDEIREKTDIVKVVSEYVNLRKRGKNYLGLCPFHSEKDASFTVSPEKQIFHCFGCNQGGNAFVFLMKIENISFVEAVAELGAKVNVPLPAISRSSSSKGDKDKLYKAVELAAKYFQDNISPAAQNYLKQRNISDKTKKQFGLGFAPAGWDNLFQHLISRGVSPETMIRAGLALPREEKGGCYDRFRNRLIFTITDHRGRAVAFGGRSLGNEEPKYLNSADTPIYHKSEVLFGLSLARDEIKRQKTAVLVEGYFDLITPFQAGLTNITASLGTALTELQSKLLARFCETVVLAFDADSAGGIAAERSIDLLRKHGLKVKVAQLSGGKDPDEIINKRGVEAFKKCLESALPYIEFKFNRILARHNPAEIESRAKALREITGILSRENDEFIQKEYAKLFASRLKTDVDTIMAEIKRNQHYGPATGKNLTRVTEKPNSKISEAERTLIALAVQNQGLLKILRPQIQASDFSLPEAQAILNLLLTAEIKGDINLSHYLLENLGDEPAKKFLSHLMLSKDLPESDDQREKILADCLGVIKDKHREDKRQAIKMEIQAAEQAGQTDKVAELLMSIKSEIS